MTKEEYLKMYKEDKLAEFVLSLMKKTIIKRDWLKYMDKLEYEGS